MDPCPFVRVMVGNLFLNLPKTSKHSSCFGRIKLNHLPCQIATIPLEAPNVDDRPVVSDEEGAVGSLTLAASFGLSKMEVEKLTGKSIFIAKKKPVVKVSVYTVGAEGMSCGGTSTDRLLGKVSVPLDLKDAVEDKSAVFHNGWISLGKKMKDDEGGGGVVIAKVHVTVLSEPDPRFVFEFDGEPECSPQVFQVQGAMRQPMFTCKFNLRSQPSSIRSPNTPQSSSRRWRFGSFGSEKERIGKERKGWAITVHDLSGSAVAFASMVTPFVASPNSDRVSQSNPGAWLILRPGGSTWKPWGRLEAWRVGCGVKDEVGCRFELVPDSTSIATTTLGVGGIDTGLFLAESMISTAKGGKFSIDLTGESQLRRTSSHAPVYNFGTVHAYRGFVMSSTVEREGKCSKPTVEIGIQNVGCAEDAAAFVALAAAIDLSMDACRPFSQKLRKELNSQSEILM